MSGSALSKKCIMSEPTVNVNVILKASEDWKGMLRNYERLS